MDLNGTLAGVNKVGISWSCVTFHNKHKTQVPKADETLDRGKGVLNSIPTSATGLLDA